MIHISRIAATFILLVLCSIPPAFGQKKPNVTRKITSGDNSPIPKLPTLKGLCFFVSLNEEGDAVVSVQVDAASDKVSAQELSRIYDYFSLSPTSKTNVSNVKFDPLIIIKAAPNLEFGKIAEFIKPLLRTGDNKIKIAIGESDFLIVPAKIEPSRMRNIKPNPLTLGVQLEKSGFITLNNELFGSMGDLLAINNRLSEIFKERRNNGVFREMTNDIESTVYLKVSANRSFGDVDKLFRAIRRSGSDRIFLFLDVHEMPGVSEWRGIIR